MPHLTPSPTTAVDLSVHPNPHLLAVQHSLCPSWHVGEWLLVAYVVAVWRLTTLAVTTPATDAPAAAAGR